MRKKIAAANWKMNKTLAEVNGFVQDFNADKAIECQKVQTLIFPPSIYLSHLSDYYRDIGINIGAQNISEYDNGAFTGEISAQMLNSIHVNHCLIGHSERRKYFGETNEILYAKLQKSLEHKMTPIFCCGEQLEDRKAKKHFRVVEHQLHNVLFQLESAFFYNVIIAYEPVWAIGTGMNATSEQAQEMHAFIRSCIEIVYGNDIAKNTRILYGGSLNSANAHDLFACADVDGGLIGGASLNPMEFLNIIQAANE
jgi:triosephosphate isomerase (TIM)